MIQATPIHSLSFNLSYDYVRFGVGFCKDIGNTDVYFECYENNECIDDNRFKDEFTQFCFRKWFKYINREDVLKYKNNLLFLYGNSLSELFHKLEDHFSDEELLNIIKQIGRYD